MTAKYSINAHLASLQNSVARMKRYKKIFDKKTFLTDEVAYDAIRKVLEETIETALTIGNIIIVDCEFDKPDKNDDIFDILARERVYSREFADKISGAGGFRNILVHNYLTIDMDLVYKFLETGIPVFSEYAKYIAKYLKKNNL